MDPRHTPPSTSLNPAAHRQAPRDAETVVMQKVTDSAKPPVIEWRKDEQKDISDALAEAKEKYGLGTKIFAYSLGSAVGTFVVAIVATSLFKLFLVYKDWLMQ